MSTGTSTPTVKTYRLSVAALAMLLGTGVLITPAAAADSADALPAGAGLYGYFHERRGEASGHAQRTNFDEIRRRTDGSVRVSFDAQEVQPAGLAAGTTASAHGQDRVRASQYHSIERPAPGLNAPVDTSPSDLLARLHYAFVGAIAPSNELSRQGESDVLLRNSDAFARAKVRLTFGKEWPAFVYADLGAVDSTLRWQGLAGIHGGHGVDLLGGWRHVTYHFSPGRGFDSLDFNGPFLGATLAW